MISTTSGNGFADVGHLKVTADPRYVDGEASGSRQVDPTFRLNWTENMGSLCHGEGGGSSPEVLGKSPKGA